MYMTLDKDLAAAFGGGGGRIEKSGAYNVRIVSAVFHESQNSNGRSESLRLEVETKARDKAIMFVNLNYANGIKNDSGQELLNALVCCLGLNGLNMPVQTTVDMWDSNAKQMTKQQKPCFVELHGKNVGLVVLMELTDSSEYPSPRIMSIYRLPDGFTASEIISGATKPEKGRQATEYVESKGTVDKRKNKPSDTMPPPVSRTQTPAQPAPVESFDDIPF